MKVLVTGSSTVGKSTVAAELNRQGITAFDGDDVPGLCRLEVKDTGEPADWPEGFVDWSYYSWNLQEPQLTDLLTQADPVVLAGIYGNQPRFYPFFDKLIVLTITPEEHARRLQHRPRRTAGDSDENMEDRIRKYPILLQRFLDAGAIPVDASGTVEQTAATIIRIMHNED